MRKSILIFASIGVVYGVVWWLLAVPYGYLSGTDQPLLFSELKHAPFLKLTLVVLQAVLPTSLGKTATLVLVHGLLCNVLTLIALGVLVRTLHEKISVALAAVLLFAVSTWPSFYLFSASEAPMSALLAVLGTICIVKAFGEPRQTSLWLTLAGVVAGLHAGTSPTALIFIFLLATAVYLLSAAWKHSMRWKWLGLYLGALLLTLGVALTTTDGAYLEFLSGKIENSTFLEELSQLGLVQKVPFGSFLFIGGYYAPTLVFAGLLGSLLFSFIFLDMKHRRSWAERILFLLCLILLLHPLLIDLMPVARTASIHYPVYPFLIAIVVLVTRYWIESLDQKPFYFGLVSSVFVLLTAAGNIWHTAELVGIKQGNARLASELTQDSDVYVLEDDIHAGVIEAWLQDSVRRIESVEQLNGISKPGVLIIGPRGAGSARTAQTVASTKDFLPSLRQPENVKAISTPYFGLYPPFLFENEVASAFYFSGSAPSRRLKNLHLTFWVFNSDAMIK